MRDTNRNNPLCRIAQSDQGKQGGCFGGAKLQIVPLKNFANGSTTFINGLKLVLHWKHKIKLLLCLSPACINGLLVPANIRFKG